MYFSGKNQSLSGDKVWQHECEQLQSGLEEQQGNFIHSCYKHITMQHIFRLAGRVSNDL